MNIERRKSFVIESLLVFIEICETCKINEKKVQVIQTTKYNNDRKFQISSDEKVTLIYDYRKNDRLFRSESKSAREK